MEIFLLYLGLGAVAGLISGLFGLGGGVVIVPILIFTFGAQGFSAEVLTHLAIGTSLATIVITSISSVTAHHKRGAVLWPVVFWLTPGICVGAALGAIFAVSITGPALQLAFGFFLCLVALTMGLSSGFCYWFCFQCVWYWWRVFICPLFFLGSGFYEERCCDIRRLWFAHCGERSHCLCLARGWSRRFA